MMMLHGMEMTSIYAIVNVEFLKFDNLDWLCCHLFLVLSQLFLLFLPSANIYLLEPTYTFYNEMNPL